MPSDARILAQAVMCLLVLFVPSLQQQQQRPQLQPQPQQPPQNRIQIFPQQPQAISAKIEVHDSGPVVVGQSVTVTCRLTRPLRNPKDFIMTWDIGELPTAQAKPPYWETKNTLVGAITLSNFSTADVYGRRATCWGLGSDGETLHSEWKPNNITAPPGPLNISGPIAVSTADVVQASCTSIGALSKQPPTIYWLDNAGSDVTFRRTGQINTTTENYKGIPVWQVSADLRKEAPPDVDGMEFECKVNHTATGVMLSKKYKVFVVDSPNESVTPQRAICEYEIVVRDVWHAVEIRRAVRNTKAHVLPTLNMSDIEKSLSGNYTRQWSFKTGVIEIVDITYYQTFIIFAITMGTLLVSFGVVIGIVSYLRRVNEHCYCC